MMQNKDFEKQWEEQGAFQGMQFSSIPVQDSTRWLSAHALWTFK